MQHRAWVAAGEGESERFASGRAITT